MVIHAVSMRICLKQSGKRYQRHWVYRNLDYTFDCPGSYALLGSNGSGKSTLLRIISGLQTASNGSITYELGELIIPQDKSFKHLAYCAPGMELPEEMTLLEFFTFHFSFKKVIEGLSIPKVIELTGLTKEIHKPIADYSSGMKQRVKLAQAIFSDTSALLLDEPATNLDDAGVAQYHAWMKEYAQNRLVIIASNDEREYRFCKHRLLVTDYCA